MRTSEIQEQFAPRSSPDASAASLLPPRGPAASIEHRWTDTSTNLARVFATRAVPHGQTMSSSGGSILPPWNAKHGRNPASQLPSPQGPDSRGNRCWSLTNVHEGSTSNPWEDLVDLPHGRIVYWGDAKRDQRGLDEFIGNRALRAAHDQVLDDNRALIPPILDFSKPSTGHVRFNGLCVIDRLEMTWFEEAARASRSALPRTSHRAGPVRC